MAEPGHKPVPKTDTETAAQESAVAKGSGSSGKLNLEDLSAEEQMANFEEELKNTDWGHQPC